MAKERTRVLVVGASQPSEFTEAIEWLDQNATISTAQSVPEAETLLSKSAASIPQIVVFCQVRPGEISFAHVERMRRRAPSAKLVALLGSWCEGEPRSGRPWTGVERIYWHDWFPRLSNLLHDDMRRTKVSPNGNTEVESLLAINPVRKPAKAGRKVSSNPQPQLRVGIAAKSIVVEETLAAACRAIDWLPVVIPPEHDDVSPAKQTFDSLQFAIWDGESMTPSEAIRLQEFCRRVSPTPVVAVLGFPRWDDRAIALAHGAAQILAKPFRLEDFKEVCAAVGKRAG